MTAAPRPPGAEAASGRNRFSDLEQLVEQDPGAADRITSYLHDVQQFHTPVEELIDRHLAGRPERVVLDIGCGAGDRLARATTVGLAVGVDRSRVGLDDARRRLGARAGRGLVQADAVRLPFPSGRADLVTCTRVLIHVARAVAALAEMVRITRPGGVIVVAEPDCADLRFGPADPTWAVVQDVATSTMANPFVGSSLPALLDGLGAEVLVDEAVAVVDTSPDRAAGLLALDSHVAHAVEVGSTTREQAAAWRDGLAEAGRAGTFRATWVTRVVVARRR